jgi:hypothetical protein
MKNLFIQPNYVGELYLIDELKKEYPDITIEELFNNYINKHYFNYLLNSSMDYSYILNKLLNIIKYRNKYNLLLNKQCQICFTSETPLHSIKFKGYLTNKDGIKKLFIYIEPAKATNFEINYICQHLLMEFDKAINLFVNKYKYISPAYISNNIFNTNIIKINIIFNMVNNKNSIHNIKIAKALYKILNECYNDEVENIHVHNFGPFMRFFTKLFSSTFNNKIIISNENLTN